MCCFWCLFSLLSRCGRLRGFPVVTLLSQLVYQKFWFDTLFSVLTGNIYWATAYTYIYKTWAYPTWIWPIFGSKGSEKNVSNSIAEWYDVVNLPCSHFSSSYIRELVTDNKARVSEYTLCTLIRDILIFPRQRICVAICLEEKDEMIWRMNLILFFCRLTCAYCFLCLRASISEIGWALGFGLILSFGMVLGAPVGSTFGYSINKFLGLELGNWFGGWEGSLVGFHFSHCLAWWLAQEKDLWLAYNWEFRLDPLLNIQIL